MLPANEGDVVAQFLDAMRSAGVNMDMGATGGPHPIADGELHRAPSVDAKKKRNLNVWYVLHLDEPSSGAFGDYAKGVQETWTVKNPQSMTADQRAILKERMDRTAELRRKQREKMAAEAAAAAAAIMAETMKASPDHGYLAKKKLAPFPGLRQIKSSVVYKIDGEEKTARAGWLFVPVFSPTGDLVGGQTIRTDGVKMFIKGTPKTGNYHSIGKAPEPGQLIVIGEGYATLARVHSATGLLCVVAFDSGNLPSVAQAIRAKYPENPITIAADNDRFTTTPVENPGLVKAKEAAFAVRGKVAVPYFPEGKPEATDFDDLFRFGGLEAIRAGINGAVPPRDAKSEAPPPPEKPEARAPEYDETRPPPMDFAPDGPGEEGEAEAPRSRERSTSPSTSGDDESKSGFASFGRPHFRCLGIDETTCYFQPANVAQVIGLPVSALKGANLYRLAPLTWWEMEFPKAKGGVDFDAAVNACIMACQYRKKFVPHNMVRGRGAWFEGETAVFHAGENIIVNGEVMPIHDHESPKFVYDEGEGIDVDLENPANDEEARRFLSICKALRWSDPLSGYLLAGWCVTAPVCGFLTWRPHIWINGPAGSGKSTVIQKIIKQTLATTAHSVVGNTSEAGIRGALGMDALPVIFDESEPKDMASQARIRSILDLARVAASESDGIILKGTANQRTKGYRARSMFAFASINTQIEGYADETRFTQLTLAAPPAETEAEVAKNAAHYTKLVSEITDLFKPGFPQRLLARTILNLPRLREYVRVFREAASIHLGQPRLGDQIGPMLAGAYLLATTKPITVEKAAEWIAKNNWLDHSAKNAARDIDRFLQHVTSYSVRHQTPEGGTWERPIADLIQIAREADKVTERDDHGQDVRVENRRKTAAVKALGRLGLAVRRSPDHGWLVDVTTTHESFKSRVLRNTEWQGTNLRRLFQSLQGVISPQRNRHFAPGVNTPYVSIPLDTFMAGGGEEADEIPEVEALWNPDDF